MIAAAQHLEKLRRSPIRAYTNLAASVPGCVKLTIGEPDMDTPAGIRAAAAAALEAGQTHYAPNQGILPLRRENAEGELIVKAVIVYQEVGYVAADENEQSKQEAESGF